MRHPLQSHPIFNFINKMMKFSRHRGVAIWNKVVERCADDEVGCNHYLLRRCRSDFVGRPGTRSGRWSKNFSRHYCLKWTEIRYCCWRRWKKNFVLNDTNPILKFWGVKRQDSPWEAISAHIKIIPQTFNTTRRRPEGKFASHALLCGAQPQMGEPKMTLWEHFGWSPLRCLKSFQSSPSWSLRE